MDINKLQTLLKVVEHSNLTRTADLLGYTQSGVTHMITSLENELGIRLLNRSRSGVFPTPEGELLLPYMQEIIYKYDRLIEEVNSIKGLTRGVISIGSFTSITMHWMPQILKAFQTACPEISIRLTKGGSTEIERGLNDGILDVAFFSRQNHYTYDLIELKKDPLLVVMSENNKLADHEFITLEELSKQPILCSPVGVDIDVDKILAEFPHKVAYTTNFDYSLVAMARQNLGVCILPGLTAQSNCEDLALRPLSPPRYRTLCIGVPSMSKASPAVKQLIKCAKQVISTEIPPE